MLQNSKVRKFSKVRQKSTWSVQGLQCQSKGCNASQRLTRSVQGQQGQSNVSKVSPRSIQGQFKVSKVSHGQKLSARVTRVTISTMDRQTYRHGQVKTFSRQLKKLWWEKHMKLRPSKHPEKVIDEYDKWQQITMITICEVCLCFCNGWVEKYKSFF